MALAAVLLGYAAPAWAPGPYPYPAPPPLPSRTERGIAQFRWAILVGIAMEALAIVLIAYVASLLGPLLASPPSPFDSTFLSLMATMIGLTCVSGVVGLIGVIFFLIGLNYMYSGRDEYGPVHVQAADRVMIFSILAIVFGIAAPIGGSFSSAFLGFGSGFTAFGTVGVIGGSLGVLRGLFVGLALVTALRAFQTEWDRTAGFIAVILLAASPAASVVVGLAFPLTTTTSNPAVLSTALYAALGAAALAAAMDLTAFVLLFLAYSRVYHRMHAGEFAGMYRPPPMFMPYYPAPMPMPYYVPPYPVQPVPPPAPPPQPPPQPPPPGS